MQTGEGIRRQMRACIDRCRASKGTRVQTDKGTHRRVHAGADVYARPYQSACALTRVRAAASASACAYVCKQNGSQWDAWVSA